MSDASRSYDAHTNALEYLRQSGVGALLGQIEDHLDSEILSAFRAGYEARGREQAHMGVTYEATLGTFTPPDGSTWSRRFGDRIDELLIQFRAALQDVIDVELAPSSPPERPSMMVYVRWSEDHKGWIATSSLHRHLAAVGDTPVYALEEFAVDLYLMKRPDREQEPSVSDHRDTYGSDAVEELRGIFDRLMAEVPTRVLTELLYRSRNAKKGEGVSLASDVGPWTILEKEERLAEDEEKRSRGEDSV